MLNFVNIKCITIDGRKKEKEDWWYPYNEKKDRFFNEVIPHLHSEEMSRMLRGGLRFIRGLRGEK
jgi:hypothetical protein